MNLVVAMCFRCKMIKVFELKFDLNLVKEFVVLVDGRNQLNGGKINIMYCCLEAVDK